MNDVTKSLSLRERARLYFLGEPTKTLIKRGVRTLDGQWTKEGNQLFKEFLLEKYGAEFVEYMKPIWEEEDKACKQD